MRLEAQGWSGKSWCAGGGIRKDSLRILLLVAPQQPNGSLHVEKSKDFIK